MTPQNPSRRSRVNPTERVTALLMKAATEAGFRDKLYSNPDEIASLYRLSEVETALLRGMSPRRVETIIGGLVVHKLLPRRVSRQFSVAPLRGGKRTHPDTITIEIDQFKTGVSIGKDGLPMGGQRAFGSGNHASTFLCLHALEDHFVPAATVLDVGTGSGILAIAAARLDATSVLALDIDRSAVLIAHENIAANGLENDVTVQHGSLDQVRGESFNLILANLVASVLGKLMEDGLLDLVAEGGKLILSGIQVSEITLIAKSLVAGGCAVVDGYRHGCWISLVAQRKSPN